MSLIQARLYDQMMSSSSQPLVSSPGVGRRILPRYQVAAPIDIVVLKSGVPETIPGRSVDLGEGGLGAIAAGELQPGQAVGVEIFLPEVSRPVRARALVKYHRQLHCGLQFLALPKQEHDALRYWINRTGIVPVPDSYVDPRRESSVQKAAATEPFYRRAAAAQKNKRSPRPPKWLIAVPVLALLLGVAAWWRWQSGWRELETQAEEVDTSSSTARVQVPSAVMTQRILHRLDPAYPEAARQAGVAGVVILNVVVGLDGAVKTIRPLSGPDDLRQAAMDAVRWWRFQPYLVDGSPAEVETTVAIDFRP